MKNESGITLIALVMTFILMTYLSAIAINFSLQSVDFMNENKFLAQMRVAEDKVRVIKKEIDVGSEAYKNVGKELANIGPFVRRDMEALLVKYNVPDEKKINYRYFDKTEMAKIGLELENDLLLSLVDGVAISTTGIKIGNEKYYTYEDARVAIEGDLQDQVQEYINETGKVPELRS